MRANPAALLALVANLYEQLVEAQEQLAQLKAEKGPAEQDNPADWPDP